MALIEINVKGATADQLDAIAQHLLDIKSTLTVQGAQIMALKEEILAKLDGAVADYNNVVAQRDQYAAELVVALGNDAADQATIDAKQAEIDAAAAENAAQATEISEARDAVANFDLDASFPPAESPADPNA